MALIYCIAQFGMTFKNNLVLTDAVRVGARKAAVSRLDPDRDSVIDQAIRDAADTLDQTKLNPISITSSWANGSTVTVSATYPYEIKILGWVAKSGSLTSTTTERVE